MAKLVQKMYSQKIGPYEMVNLTLNIGILSIFFTFFGAFVSYIFYYIFDEYGPDDEPKRGMEWEKHSALRQIADISLEITLIGVVSFWLTYYFNTSAPIFPVRSSLVSFVDTYTTGMFFMFTIFLFTNDLSSKLRYVYNEYVGYHFDVIFPAYGSIWDLNLRYSKN
jgi:hypothetical protein